MNKVSAIGVCLAACAGNEKPAATTAAVEITAADLRLSPKGDVFIIAPQRLEPLRIAGDKLIIPTGDIIEAARQSGATLRGSFKFCVDGSGNTSDITTIQSTHVASYDALIVSKMKEWAYRPVTVDGKAVAVCSAATFIFTAR